jgi:hypothetical protein
MFTPFHVEKWCKKNPLRLLDTCIICYDTLDDEWNTCIRTNRETFYFNADFEYRFTCKCNICLHETCMELWYITVPKCPVCFTELVSTRVVNNTQSQIVWFIQLLQQFITFLLTYFMAYTMLYYIWIISMGLPWILP